ncbi:MAG: hypothetical protein GC192_13575 [Bacteroidetes bacterium]|nr:hypothetical protein [Bacteroidota bacterium]
MKLPNFEHATIREEKLEKYLLNISHPDGASKARFFMQRGFSTESANNLRLALLEHAKEGKVVEEIQNPFGMKYVLKGFLKCPNGTKPNLCSIWIIENGKDIPELVTAYPS